MERVIFFQFFLKLLIYLLIFKICFLEIWIRAKRGDNVLDLCCGSGDLAFLLSERVGSDGKVYILPFFSLSA